MGGRKGMDKRKEKNGSNEMDGRKVEGRKGRKD